MSTLFGPDILLLVLHKNNRNKRIKTSLLDPKISSVFSFIFLEYLNCSQGYLSIICLQND